MLYTFDTVYPNTARKNGQKYLGKDGSQAWSVAIKINGETYYNMIYDEQLIPIKGREYNIELSEENGFKNWKYKLLTKKEQVLAQTQPQVEEAPLPESPYSVGVAQAPKKEEKEAVDWEAISRGKVRHGVAVAFIRQGKELLDPIVKEVEDKNRQIKKEMELWVDYIMNGY